MTFRYVFAKALKQSRKARGLRQEDFSVVSSRTYLSVLERGQKSPTLEKTHELAEVLGIHVLTLLTLAALYLEPELDIDGLLSRVRRELEQLNGSSAEGIRSSRRPPAGESHTGSP